MIEADDADATAGCFALRASRLAMVKAKEAAFSGEHGRERSASRFRMVRLRPTYMGLLRASEDKYARFLRDGVVLGTRVLGRFEKIGEQDVEPGGDILTVVCHAPLRSARPL